MDYKNDARRYQKRPRSQFNSPGSHSSCNKFVNTVVKNATVIGVRYR